jgi:ankyrin repeat protein
VEKNNLKMLKQLRKCIKNIHFRDYTKKNPLHIAAINGSYEIAKFLIKCKININEMDDKKFTPLNYACINKHRDVALLIKENGGIMHQLDDIGILFCNYASSGDLEALKIFYECGANLMACDYDKRTAAHIASAENNVEMMRFLVEQTKCNVMVEDRWGNTPYSGASEEIKTIIEGKYKTEKLSKKKSKMKSHLLN